MPVNDNNGSKKRYSAAEACMIGARAAAQIERRHLGKFTPETRALLVKLTEDPGVTLFFNPDAEAELVRVEETFYDEFDHPDAKYALVPAHAFNLLAKAYEHSVATGEDRLVGCRMFLIYCDTLKHCGLAVIVDDEEAQGMSSFVVADREFATEWFEGAASLAAMAENESGRPLTSAGDEEDFEAC
jgi:hypothetical protein